MGKSTEDQSSKSKQMTFEDLPNVIGLPESEAGHLPCNSQDGIQIDKFGLDLVPASRSAKRGNRKPKKTKDTSGRKCSGSSESVSLTQCLASRLRQRLDTVGLMEYRTTWKQKVTPSGRLYWEHSASAHRTSEADCIGWVSPTATDGSHERTFEPRQVDQGIQLANQAQLTGWMSPNTVDAAGGNRNGPGQKQLCHQVHGLITESSNAQTANRGVLDAAFSRWLMGFPATWDEASPSYQSWLDVQEAIVSED
jgi:hypothetical protein